jgi:hypothetical protein
VFPFKLGHNLADYLLHTDGKVVGVIGARKEGVGHANVETRFTRALPSPFSRPVSAFHKPAQLVDWMESSQNKVAKANCHHSLTNEAEVQANANIQHD